MDIQGTAQPTAPVETSTPAIESPTEYLSPEEIATLSKKKVKHKVDGKDVETSFEELQKGYAHNTAASKRMQEAAAERKAIQSDKANMDAEVAKLKDPKEAKAFLKKYLGDDGFSNLAHETVMEALRKEAMTPEEIQHEQDSEELKQYRDTKAKETEKIQADSHKQRIETFVDDLTKDLSEFVKAQGGTIHPHEMESLLGLMLDSMENDVELSLDDAWKYVKKQETARFDRYLSTVDIASLPKEFIEKVRKQSLAALPSRSKGDSKQTQIQKPSPKQDDTFDAGEFFKKMRK